MNVIGISPFILWTLYRHAGDTEIFTLLKQPLYGNMPQRGAHRQDAFAEENVQATARYPAAHPLFFSFLIVVVDAPVTVIDSGLAFMYHGKPTLAAVIELAGTGFALNTKLLQIDQLSKALCPINSIGVQ